MEMAQKEQLMEAFAGLSEWRTLRHYWLSLSGKKSHGLHGFSLGEA